MALEASVDDMPYRNQDAGQDSTMPPGSDILERNETNDVVYELTATTFTKTSRLPQVVEGMDGSDFTWFRPLNHERITNEANALRLLARKTTIPVPRLIDSGIHPDGTRYLTTERIDGFTLDTLLKDGCPLSKHTDKIPCEICQEKAYSNALQFIRNTVLPQLANLKSRERGICGFVMPPQWLNYAFAPWKDYGPWKTHQSEEAQYTFQHGDLAAHNILMNPQTLEVAALIDWEYAGFFPPGMEIWLDTLDQHAYRRRGNAGAIVKFLADECLECCERCEDKAQLERLVAKGEIPDLGRLRLACRKAAEEE